MANYSIVEPHPTAYPNTYVHSGRGGAGNTFRSAEVKAANGPSAATLAASSKRRFYTGIGGFGNRHAANERPSPAVAFDDEVHRAALREESDAAMPRHVGIGGAGNVISRRESSSSDTASEKSPRGSEDSIWSRISSTIQRN